MSFAPEHIAGQTSHTRRGAIRNAFTYGVDFVMIDPENSGPSPALFSRNRFNLVAVRDRDHGGPVGKGKGAPWARAHFDKAGLEGATLRLLTQPSYLGYCFNPVSFWLAYRGDDLMGVIAEVSTPFGDRHSYLCRAPDGGPITAQTRISRPKSLHVSPFQEVSGDYGFTFDITPERISIRILHKRGPEGLAATLSGPRAPLTNAALIRASLRRPLGAIRTIALIHWQALKLKIKGAHYLTRPTPPSEEITK